MKHDPIDSLIYLHKSVALSIGGLMEQIQDTYGWEDDDEIMADYVAWSESLQKQIGDEFRRHYDGREAYSTGVPFRRECKYPSTEPDGSGGVNPVISQATVIMHPDGSPKSPFDGGIWVD